MKWNRVILAALASAAMGAVLAGWNWGMSLPQGWNWG